MASWGINEEPVMGRASEDHLSQLHEAMQGAVGRPHQVDQAGLAVADRVRLWNHEVESLGQTDRFHS